MTSLGAPAEAVYCFPIFKGSLDSLAREHLSDVGTRFTKTRNLLVFALSHVSCSIRLITTRHWLLPTSPNRPSMGLPYGWLAMYRTWRTAGLSTFHVIALTDNLGGILYAGGTMIPCSYVRDLQPGHACTHKGTCLRPISSSRSDRFDDACGPSTILTILSNPSP